MGVLLKGKHALIMGVANQRSIAWGIASAFHREGATLAFTYQGERLKENLDELLDTIGGDATVPTFPSHVQNQPQLEAAFPGPQDRWGRPEARAPRIALVPPADLGRPLPEIVPGALDLAL